MRRLAPLLIAGILVGCGKDSPTGPVAVASTTTTTTTLPTVSEVRDGITGSLLTASVQPNGAMVRVTAPGYLTRTQPVTTTLYLWPHAESYVEQLVYWSTGNGAAS